jgi:tRNA threonylcarbamoyladenosine biosynthesis protein TsaE
MGCMSTDLTWQTVSTSSANTERLATELGTRCKGGEVIELISDLGGGKTTFVRGLAKGMGSTDNVASPSFTLSREYKAGKLTIYHFDFYRLSEPGIIENELVELIGDPSGVVVIEWADIVEDVLPAERLTIRLERTGEDSRKFTYEYPSSLTYLVEKNT